MTQAHWLRFTARDMTNNLRAKDRLDLEEMADRLEELKEGSDA